MALDQSHEQSKLCIKGDAHGIVGFAEDPSVLCRWMLAHGWTRNNAKKLSLIEPMGDDSATTVLVIINKHHACHIIKQHLQRRLMLTLS